MEAPTVYFFSSVSRILTSGIKNPLVVSLSSAFSDNLITLTADKLTADELMVILEGKTMGNTAENLTLKKDTCTIFSIVSSLASAHGATIGDGDLTGMKIHTYNELFESKPEELVKILDKILKVVDDNKTPLLAHGVSPAIVLKMKGYRDSYSEKKFTTKDAIDLHKNTKIQLKKLKRQKIF